jgi:hypothetical protein
MTGGAETHGQKKIAYLPTRSLKGMWGQHPGGSQKNWGMPA